MKIGLKLGIDGANGCGWDSRCRERTRELIINLNWIGGIGTGKANTTTTLGLNYVADQAPTTCRKAEFQ